jgi:hypothetical protein
MRRCSLGHAYYSVVNTKYYVTYAIELIHNISILMMVKQQVLALIRRWSRISILPTTKPYVLLTWAPLKKRIYYPRYGYVYSPRVNLWPTDHGFNVVARVYVAFG